MAVITNPQRNLPLVCEKPRISLPRQAQADAIAALADLIVQLWETNGLMGNSPEDKIDE